tara:strand:- start:224 stop:469 length:246 start_codon:yes stop_codon:yes gene_type:complete
MYKTNNKFNKIIKKKSIKKQHKKTKKKSKKKQITYINKINNEYKLALKYINKYNITKAQKHLRNIQIYKNIKNIKNIKNKN